MARWEPDARGRLQQAAVELFEEQGYAGTTVAQVAERAGVTERTFFRCFADKREVLFHGSERLADGLLAGLEASSATAPLDQVADAWAATADFFSDRERSWRRQQLIDADAELMERELIKMAGLTAALASALRDRGVAEPAASLAAQAGTGAFHVAFQRWVRREGRECFADELDDSLAALRALVAG